MSACAFLFCTANQAAQRRAPHARVAFITNGSLNSILPSYGTYIFEKRFNFKRFGANSCKKKNALQFVQRLVATEQRQPQPQPQQHQQQHLVRFHTPNQILRGVFGVSVHLCGFYVPSSTFSAEAQLRAQSLRVSVSTAALFFSIFKPVSERPDNTADTQMCIVFTCNMCALRISNVCSQMW